MGANDGSQLNTSDSRLAKLLEYASDTAQVQRYTSPIDGVERMGVFLNLNERKWVLAVGLARKDVLHGWYYQALWTALAILVISITQWFLMHYIHVNACSGRVSSRRRGSIRSPGWQTVASLMSGLCGPAILPVGISNPVPDEHGSGFLQAY
jgi:hypothetical protein